MSQPRYVGPGNAWLLQGRPRPVKEHLERSCTTCGYVATEQTLDAQP